MGLLPRRQAKSLQRHCFNTNIHLKPYNGLEQLRRKEAKCRVGNIGRIENDIGIIPKNLEGDYHEQESGEKQTYQACNFK